MFCFNNNKKTQYTVKYLRFFGFFFEINCSLVHQHRLQFQAFRL